MRPVQVDSGPAGAREGDIPYWAEWSDGSKYSVEWAGQGFARRTFSGPMFNTATDGLDTGWKSEVFPTFDEVSR